MDLLDAKVQILEKLDGYLASSSVPLLIMSATVIRDILQTKSGQFALQQLDQHTRDRLTPYGSLSSRITLPPKFVMAQDTNVWDPSRKEYPEWICSLTTQLTAYALTFFTITDPDTILFIAIIAIPLRMKFSSVANHCVNPKWNLQNGYFRLLSRIYTLESLQTW